MIKETTLKNANAFVSTFYFLPTHKTRLKNKKSLQPKHQRQQLQWTTKQRQNAST